jgi:RNA polymerase sigma factor (sigma-70 family)
MKVNSSKRNASQKNGNTAFEGLHQLSLEEGTPSMHQPNADLILEEDLASVRRSLMRNWLRLGVALADAEDLAQAGILRGLMNLEKFRGEANLKTWLITVGKNAGYDFLRREARQGRIKRRMFDAIEVVTLRRQSGRRKTVVPIE